MIFYRKPKNLTQWLNIATKSLVWFEAEKVAREINGHFEDELEVQLQLGVSPSDAEKLALATLGDPLKAHRLFQKVHLTKVEWEDYVNHQPNAEWYESGFKPQAGGFINPLF